MLDREQAVVPADVVAALPNYLFVIPIGSGGQAMVYKAVEPVTNRTVAVKVFKGSAGENELRRFQREVELLDEMQHANIVDILESGLLGDGRPYLVMACVDGAMDITTYCWSRSLGPRDVVPIMRQVCDAVAHAHAMGLVHRDLKPSNIVIDGDGVPMLLDFGLATNPKDSYDTSGLTALGTLPYMAPEQTVGRGGPRADVYALGAVLFELVTGRPVVDTTGLTDAGVMERVLTPDASAWRRSLADAPKDLRAIVMKALSRDARNRYADARELEEDLGRFSRGDAVRARADQIGYVLRTWVRRRYGVTTVALLGLFALAAGAWGGLQRAQLAAERRARLGGMMMTSVLRLAGHSRDMDRVIEADELFASVIEDGMPYIDDVEVRAFVVEAYRRRSEMAIHEGAPANGLHLADQGMQLVLELDSSDDRWLKLTGSLHRLRAKALSRLDRYDDAVAAADEAVSIREGLVERKPEELNLVNDLAMAFQTRGQTHRQDKRLALAEADYQKSYALRRELLRRNPRSPSHIMSAAFAALQMSAFHLSYDEPAKDEIGGDYLDEVEELLASRLVEDRIYDLERLRIAVKKNRDLIKRRRARAQAPDTPL